MDAEAIPASMAQERVQAGLVCNPRVVPGEGTLRFIHFPSVDVKRWVRSKGSPVRLLVAAGLALVLSGACGAHSASNGAADSQFLSAVHDAAPNIGSFRTDTELIRIGHAACDGFSSHATYEQLADRLTLEEGNNPLPSEDLGAVITSAVEAFCPQFDDQVS